MSLEDFERAGWIIRIEPRPADMQAAFGIIRRDLSVAADSSVDRDWRFNVGYNAALKVAEAALLATGWRVERGGAKHERAIETLRYTMEIDSGVVRTLQAFRKKRNLVEYEAAGLVSETEVGELLRLAQDLSTRFETWLGESHPDLTGTAS